MRLKWLISAILGAVLAAIIVLFWPVRPLWMWLDTVPASVDLFSPDGKSLYTNHYPPKGESPFLCQWDAVTGALIHKTVLEGLISTGLGKNEFSIRLSQDARTVFVSNRTNFANATDTWHLYDAQTGKCRSEAIRNVGHFNPAADSPNGHWFWTYHGSRQNNKLNEGLDIYSMETAKPVLELRPDQAVRPWSIQLHPVKDQALVMWSNGKDQSYFQLINLPDGEEVRRFSLPVLPTGQRWEGMHCWTDDFLWVEYSVPDAAKPDNFRFFDRRTRRFDLRLDVPDEGIEEPLFHGGMRGDDGQSYFENGDNWVAYFRDYYPEKDQSVLPWLDVCRAWIEKKLNMPKPSFNSLATVRIVNRPSGTEKYAMPYPVGNPLVMTKDGRYLACGTKAGGVAVFDLAPMPRWAIALLASLGTGGMILLLGRWRSRVITKVV